MLIKINELNETNMKFSETLHLTYCIKRSYGWTLYYVKQTKNGIDEIGGGRIAPEGITYSVVGTSVTSNICMVIFINLVFTKL